MSSKPKIAPPATPPILASDIYSKWYHPKGWFTVTVLTLLEHHVTYFIDQHCDNTYAHAAEAEEGDGLVQRTWFEDNAVRCMTRERFIASFTRDVVPLVKRPIVHYDERGNLIVEVEPPVSIE